MNDQRLSFGQAVILAVLWSVAAFWLPLVMLVLFILKVT